MTARARGVPKIKTSVELCEENRDQLRRLADAYHLPVSSVIAQAIAKWYYADLAIIQQREKSNGSDHS